MSKDIYEKFLRLAGFEENEMAQFLPEWRIAAKKLGLSEEDIKFATEKWIPEHFDIGLLGIRKFIGSRIREITDMTKANEYKEKGVKIVYGILPAIMDYYYALKLTAPDKVYVSFPDISLVGTLNGFFHKLNPLLDEAEKAGIAYGCRHCALNKTRYAARRIGLIPAPDISWIFGFICDEGPKTDEFIRVYHDPGWKTYYTRIPHDQPMGAAEDEDVERVEYLANQMKDGFEFVQKEIGIKVADEKIKEVQDMRRRYSLKLAELYRLMSIDPPPISGEICNYFFDPVGVPYNTGFQHMENALDILIKELKQREAKGEGILPKGSPKLMVYFLPHSLPWVARMFESNGVGVPLSLFYALSKKEIAPPKFTDPYMVTAEAWFKRGCRVNVGYEAESIVDKLDMYGADGMLFGFFDFDRWWGAHHRLLSRIVEEKTKLPVFYIEGDIYEDRDYSPEALRTRIESICEIMKMRKG